MYYQLGQKEKILIIGGNVSGLAAASQARRVSPDVEITVLESGDYISYGTCGLPYYISDVVTDPKKLFAYPESFFKEKRNIDVLKNHEVLGLDPQKRQILASVNKSKDLKVFQYDRLVICSGAKPIDLDIEGLEGENVFHFRNVEDTFGLKKYILSNRPRKAVIIGAGSIGLLMAEALKKNSIDVTVIEKTKNIFNEFETEISTVLLKKLALEDVAVHTDTVVLSAANEGGKVKNIQVNKKGSLLHIETDLVILSAGIVANTSFLKKTSIETGIFDAIKTSPKMQTSYTNIYAAGDCCCLKNIVTGKYDYIPTANNAAKMGRVAGENILGGNMVFPGSVGTKIDVIFDFEIAKTGIGIDKATELGHNAFKITDSYYSHAKALPDSTMITVSLVIDFPTRKILGAQMIGNECIAKRIDIFATALTTEMTIDDIYMVDLSYSPTTSTVWDAVNKICAKAVLAIEKKRF